VERPENGMRWHWAAGDVAIWDHRATQHYAVDDYGDARRIVRRVSVAGTAPVGIDGRRSAIRSKTARTQPAASERPA
jgi:alpha-ketoglutarate-dependent sulfate ester dioxygenase